MENELNCTREKNKVLMHTATCTLHPLTNEPWYPLFTSMNRSLQERTQLLAFAVFRLERFTELRQFTYLGKHFPCVNDN